MTNSNYFAETKKLIKKIADTSEAHRVAMENLKKVWPAEKANNLALVQDMGWQIVMAAR